MPGKILPDRCSAPLRRDNGGMSNILSRPLGITLGDAAGIGPELVLKLHAKGLPYPAIVYGDAGALTRARAYSGAAAASLEIQEIDHPRDACFRPGLVPVISRATPLPAGLPLGRVSALAGLSAYEAICHAIDDTLAGHLHAVVTAPIHKEALQAAGVDFPGHTEILATRCATDDYAMVLVDDCLRVLLATIHIALSEVPARITPEGQRRSLALAHRVCRQLGVAHPRIAVAGLNPHAGEGGKFGLEDRDIIAPAVAWARAQGYDASGPWPGDTVFMRARQGEFDIVVAQYHDQGLIPVKYLGLDQGVNITAGLPIVRTSVDHGTAFDIAGKGIADEASLRVACDMAAAMSPEAR